MSVIKAYRMCRQRFSPKDATGSKQFGGRWNPPGHPMLYAASTISLACLEILVHMRDPELFPDDFTFTPIEFPERICASWPPAIGRVLHLEGEFMSRQIGTLFLSTKQSVVQTVPSVVVPQEMNYLINPEHPEFDAIHWGEQQPFTFDKRLLQAGLR